MNRFLSVIFLVLFAVISVNAQETEKEPKYNVFGGFSKQFVLEDTKPTGLLAPKRDAFSLNGFDFNGEYNVYQNGNFYLGAIGDFSGHYGRTEGPAFTSVGLHNFLGGARASYEIQDTVRIFGEGSLGVARLSGYGDSTAKFASAVGGGLDFYVNKSFFIRPIEVNYMLTKFGPGTPMTPFGSSGAQHSIRTSFGAGFRF